MPPPVVAPTPPPSAPSLTLVGVIADDEGSQAVLRAEGRSGDIRVRVGDDVSGWKVTEIGERQLTLKLEDRVLPLTLFAAKSPIHGGGPARRANAAAVDR
jgi:hypothetical protein